jgi:hypothetical protein
MDLVPRQYVEKSMHSLYIPNQDFAIFAGQIADQLMESVLRVRNLKIYGISSYEAIR